MAKAREYKSWLDQAKKKTENKDYDSAIILYKNAIEKGLQNKDYDFVSYAILQSSHNYRLNSQLSESINQIKEVVAIVKEDCKPEDIAKIQITSAYIASSIMDYDYALYCAKGVFDTESENNIASYLADALNILSHINDISMRLDNAIYYLKKSINYYQGTDAYHAHSRAHSQLGLLFAKSGNFAQALESTARGYTIASENESIPAMKYNLMAECRIHQMIGDFRNASISYEQGSKIKTSQHQFDYHLSILSGNCTLGFSLYNIAYDEFNTLYEFFTTNNLTAFIVDAALGLGCASASMYDFAKASEWFWSCYDRIPPVSMSYRTETIIALLEGLMVTDGLLWKTEKKIGVKYMIDNLRKMNKERLRNVYSFPIKSMIIIDDLMELTNELRDKSPRIYQKAGISIALNSGEITYTNGQTGSKFTKTELIIFKALTQYPNSRLDTETLYTMTHDKTPFHSNLSHSIHVHINNMNEKIRPYLEIEGSYSEGYKLVVLGYI